MLGRGVWFCIQRLTGCEVIPRLLVSLPCLPYFRRLKRRKLPVETYLSLGNRERADTSVSSIPVGIKFFIQLSFKICKGLDV